MMRRIFEMQGLHALLLALLLLGVGWSATWESVLDGELWGISSPEWLWIAVLLAVAHQVLVWFCWRTELHTSLLSRVLGDRGFTLYAIMFSIVGLARVAAVVILAVANEGTLSGNPAAFKVIAVLVALPAMYLFYSVKRYFGFRRAFGIDHFDPSYRSLPKVNQGIYRFTSNGMYVFGFLILWAIALWFGSVAALCAALFNHLYIGVHYLCTERPDMRRIYGEG